MSKLYLLPGPLLVRWRGWHNSVRLWAFSCRVTQDRHVIVKSSDRMWSTAGRSGRPLQYSRCGNPMSCTKRQTDMAQKDESPRLEGVQYCCWGRVEDSSKQPRKEWSYAHLGLTQGSCLKQEANQRNNHTDFRVQWFRIHQPMQGTQRLNTWSRKIPRAAQQISPCATSTTDPVIWNPKWRTITMRSPPTASGINQSIATNTSVCFKTKKIYQTEQKL